MTNTGTAQVYALGDLAPAQGELGPTHSRGTADQMRVATDLVTAARSYTDRIGTTVVCVEDRLHRPDPRLAGGVVSLALMHHFLYGGRFLSVTLEALRNQGFRRAAHKDCGALKLVVRLVRDRLSDVSAEGYQLLEALGVDVPLKTRQAVARWASTLPEDYVDLEKSLALFDELDDVEGEHNAVFAAISLEDGVSFTAGPELKRQTNGLLSFAFDPWAARRAAKLMIDSPEEQLEAETVALVFTAQVFLALGGSDLRVAVHR